MLSSVLFHLALIALPVSFNVRDFGAKGDGVAKDTVAIQAAIDAAARRGGGDVVVPSGHYLSGTIHLRSHVTLELQNGAVLLASPSDADFEPCETLFHSNLEDVETACFHRALVVGENLEHVAVVGSGMIDGNRTKRGGPKPLALKNCRHVTVLGITIRNSPNYSLSLLSCDWVVVQGVTVLNSYADGIDPDNCRFVRIADCHIESSDDAICPKASLAQGKPGLTEGVVVTNCVIRTNSANLKLGTESAGTFRNIVFSNCVMLPRKSGRRPTSGIEISMVDGGRIENVVISNVSMMDVSAPFFIRLGNRGRGQATPLPGVLADIMIENVVARGIELAGSITGLSSHPVRDVSLHNVSIQSEGGRNDPESITVPELPRDYPKAWMFGHLPAYGLFARHVQGLTLSNFHVRWAKEDLRPAMIFNDVQDADIDGFRTDTAAGALPVLWLNSVRDVLVRGSWVAAAQKFLRVSGPDSRAIKLVGNDFSNSGQAVELVNVPKSAVIEVGNVPPAHRARSRGRAIQPSRKDP